MKHLKKLMALLLALAMVFSCVLVAYAEEDAEAEETVEEEAGEEAEAEEETEAETEEPEAEPLEETYGNAVERVDELELAGRTCYMYVPASDRVGRFLGFAAMLMVIYKYAKRRYTHGKKSHRSYQTSDPGR